MVTREEIRMKMDEAAARLSAANGAIKAGGETVKDAFSTAAQTGRDARDKVKANAEKVRMNVGEAAGKAKANAEKAKAGVEAAKDSVTDAVETAQIKAMLAQDELREVTQSAMDRAADAAATVKGNVEAGREGARNAAEQGKQKLNASALKAQMSLRAAKEDMQAKIEAAKLARDQEKLENALLDTLDYADSCVALSEVAAQEAALAYLEAIAIADELENL